MADVDPRLAALLAGQSVDFDTEDILQKMRAEKARQDLRGIRPPGPIGPDGQEVEFPEGTLIQGGQYPDPRKVALDAARGLMMSSGMTGGPRGAVTGAIGHVGQMIANSPLARTLAGVVGAGAAATPSTVGSAEDALGQMTKQLDELIKQRAEEQATMGRSQAARDLQFKGDPKKKIAPGVGPAHKAAQDEATEGAARLKRMDDEISKLGKRIEVEQYNRSPAGVLEAEQKRRDFENKKKAEEFGKPIREHLPPWAADAVPIAATLAGIGSMAYLKGRANKEYGRAIDAFRTAQKADDVPEMALRQAQLADLGKGTVGQKATTAIAALLPAEVRLIETVIDANKDPESRASKEAWARIKDPGKLAWDVGTTGLSSALAYGIGSKYAPHQHPDRALGKVIASRSPYGGAPALADDYADALGAGENLRRLRPNGRLAVGASLTLLQSDGTDPAWVAPATALASLTADQTAMEAASSTALWVSPGRQQFHPSAAKAWGFFNYSAAISASYNITSLTDDGAGLVGVVIATDFSSANWCGLACANSNADFAATMGQTVAAGTCQLRTFNQGGFAADAALVNFAAFGDQ
jgi:hypothetical protein